MPRKATPVPASLREVDVDEDLFDLSAEQEDREVATLAAMGQSGAHTRSTVSSDDNIYG